MRDRHPSQTTHHVDSRWARLVLASLVGVVFACGDSSGRRPSGDGTATPYGGDPGHRDAGATADGGGNAADSGREVPLVGACTPCSRLSAELRGFERCCGGPFAESCGIRVMGTVECVVDCATDEDCLVMGEDYLCVDREARFCAPRCLSNHDCPDDEVCGLRKNVEDDRVDAFCLDPLGPGAVGARCNVAEDCVSGTCTPGPDVEGDNLCTALCLDDADCGGVFPLCRLAGIIAPSGNYETGFDICQAE